MPESFQVRCSNSTRPLLDALLPGFEREFAVEVELIVDSSKNALARIEAGEPGDLAILQDAAIDKLVAASILDSRVCRPFANALIGLAVRKGGPKPSIDSVETFTRALLDAPSIAHTEFGPSGRYFPELVERLGIASQMKQKTVTRPGGYIGRVVAAGEAQMAFQQMSELLAVPGLEILGPIPPEVQRGIVTKAAMFTSCRQQKLATELLAFFARPEHETTFQAAGLEKLIDSKQ